MDDSFRLFVEECDTFQVGPLLAWWVVDGVNNSGRDCNFVPIMPPLAPSPTRSLLHSVMNSRNSPL